jgi:uncharacterized coiled-coil DUF342 family protein
VTDEKRAAGGAPQVTTKHAQADAAITLLRDAAKLVKVTGDEAAYAKERIVELTDEIGDLRGDLDKAHGELGDLREMRKQHERITDGIQDLRRGIIDLDELVKMAAIG